MPTKTAACLLNAQSHAELQVYRLIMVKQTLYPASHDAACGKQFNIQSLYEINE